MTSKAHRSLDQFMKVTPINPRTCRAWTLVDVEVRERVEALQREVTSSPEKAKSFLIKTGMLTQSGKLPRKYGGS